MTFYSRSKHLLLNRNYPFTSYIKYRFYKLRNFDFRIKVLSETFSSWSRFFVIGSSSSALPPTNCFWVENLEIQTHFVLKIRHQNITVILCLLYYCKIRFAVLVLGRTWENLPILTQMFSFLTTRLMKYNRRRRRSFSWAKKILQIAVRNQCASHFPHIIECLLILGSTL